MTEREEEISTAMPKDLDALPRRGGFRLRGLEMTRLESFVDATFAFAVSLLVVAGQQVPDDLDTLLRAFNNVRRSLLPSRSWVFSGAVIGSGAGGSDWKTASPVSLAGR
jgi:hypothetical protein